MKRRSHDADNEREAIYLVDNLMPEIEALLKEDPTLTITELMKKTGASRYHVNWCLYAVKTKE